MIWKPNMQKQFENLARNMKLVDLTNNVTIRQDTWLWGFVAKEGDGEEQFFMTAELWHLVKDRYGKRYGDNFLKRVLWHFYKSRCRE